MLIDFIKVWIKKIYKNIFQTLDFSAPVIDIVEDFYLLGKREKLYSVAIELAEIREGDKVLDVGCGTGMLDILLKKKIGDIGQLVGINPGIKMLKKAKKKAERNGLEIDFHLGVIEDLHFKDNYFDKVIASFVFHHIPFKLKKRGLKEIYRVLKQEGNLTIIEYGKPSNRLMLLWVFLTIFEYSAIFFRGKFICIIEEAGFKFIKYQPFLLKGLYSIYRADKIL